jgi:hypothetical protein
MKHIVQYAVVDTERNTTYGVFLDYSKAQEWLEIANRGYCRRIGWFGDSFEIVERQHEIGKTGDVKFWRY